MHFEEHPPPYDTQLVQVPSHRLGIPEAPPNKTKIRNLGPFKNWSFPNGYLEKRISQSAETTKT